MSATTRAGDPLEALGRELASIAAEHDVLDSMATENKPSIASDRTGYLDARRDAIEAMIATSKATSLAGALIQVCLIRGLVELVTAGTLEADRDRAALQCELIAYSIADAIEDATGLSREELFRGNYYTRRDLNPLDPVSPGEE